MTLAMLAFQRFMMVTRNRQFPLSTPLSTILTLVFIWTYTLSVSIPPLLGWGTFNLNNLHVREVNPKLMLFPHNCKKLLTMLSLSSCGVLWAGSEKEHFMHLTYMFYIYGFGFILPGSVIFSSYLQIFKTIKLKVRHSHSLDVKDYFLEQHVCYKLWYLSRLTWHQGLKSTFASWERALRWL